MPLLYLLVGKENIHQLVVELGTKIYPKFGFCVRFFMQRINIQALIGNSTLKS